MNQMQPKTSVSILLVFLSLTQQQASAQSHVFTLCPVSQQCPAGVYATLTPPAGWVKTVNSNTVYWKKKSTGASIKAEVYETREMSGTLSTILKKSKNTVETGTQDFLDDHTKQKTGEISWNTEYLKVAYSSRTTISIHNASHFLYITEMWWEKDDKNDIKEFLSSVKIKGTALPPQPISRAENIGLFPFESYSLFDTLIGFKNEFGLVVVPPKYHWASEPFTGHIVVGKKDKSKPGSPWLFAFIDKTGKEICDLKYEELGWFYEGMAAAKLNSKWGFLNEKGKLVVPAEYDYVQEFSDGMAAVNKGRIFNKDGGIIEHGSFGFVDRSGVLVIPFQYKSTYGFHEGRAQVTDVNGRQFLIDKTGREIK